MADQPYGQSSQRPGSIRSVASNSSIASGVSLTRRARTRARSKTLTGGSSPRPDGLPQNPVSELAYLDKAYVQEPVQSLPLTPTEPLSAPPRPPRSPHRATSEAVAVQIGESGQPSLEDDLITANYTMEPERSPVVLKLPKLARQTSGLQIMPTAAQPQPPPSAFSRDPSLTRINTSAINVRDSLSTQVSGMSSSIYPPSTSTTSGPDSPLSPRSIVEPDDNYDVSSYDPEVDETQEYDGDDVSYRLRLLVKNNYFLPPAHSKPSPADFASSGLNAPPKKPVRSATPTFMDLFRGKSKSKPSTPTGSAPGFDPTPALRTAADSITASFALRPQPRTSMQGTRPETRSGRVVVVREKMQDLVVAAKQAEHDMKSRGVRREPDPQPGQGVFNHVIDPTDAVDLPPPSSTYPFSVQASALHGLGVQDSVGAALLADRLPPPNSPGMTSSNDGEDSWRKALLQQAVHLSFDSMSPDASFSMIGTTSTPLASPRLHHSESAPRGRPRTASSIPKPLLEQRIMSHSRASDASPPLARSKSTRSQASSKGRTSGKLSPLDTSRPYSFLPLRAETPSGPLTPLTPPPRRYLFNPLHSFSQTELHRSETYSGHNVPPSGSGSPSVSLRKTMSSPRLSSVYASDVRHLLTTPPPLPTPTMSTRSSLREVISPSFDDLHDHDTESRYSDDVPYANDAPRMSIALSAVDGRPSLSDYSQPSPSPSTSTFRDALTSPGDYSSSSNQRSWRPSVDQDVLSVRDSPVPRYSTMSPPPRISSSMAHIGLSPAPRSSSFRYQALVSRPSTSTHVSEPERPSTPLTDDPTLIIVAPEPTTPPFPTFPINERRGNPAARQLSLDVPSTNISVPIHSAPGPSSPTSFFDSIQEQPNAMDDLDDSSSEGENDDSYQDLDERLPPPRRPFLDSRNRAMSSASAPPRSPMMRLGNHSTPYVSQAVDGHRPSLPFGVQDPMQPIGHIPARAAFFTDRSGKSDQGHGAPVSSFDFYKYTQQYPAATAPAPESSSQRQSNVGPVAAWRNDQKAQESLRKLDGMLIQHMETEKDTIKRIATTVRSNLPVDQRV